MAVVLDMYFTIIRTASKAACYKQIFGDIISFGAFEKISSRSFFSGLFLMTATRARVSILACLIFFLLMIIPALVQMQIYFCASKG
jgi:hypothetical protein